MGTVPIAHLYSKDHQLTVDFGLLQGSRWTVSMGDYEGVIDAIENAIRSGNVAMDGGGVDRSALETMVVRAYYTMTLELPYGATPESGAYTIRLLLPEELRTSTLGMQVAYYHEATGELVVLDTHRDGEYLVFESTRSGICGFVILCDEEMDLTGLMIGLSATLLAQLIAIAYLMVRRSKSAKVKRHYGVALPAVLAIRFLPANALAITVALGILVVLAQIFLIVLLLSTEVTYRYKDGSTPRESHDARRRRRSYYAEPEEKSDTAEDETLAYEPLEENASSENEPLLVALTEEELAQDAIYEETLEDEEAFVDDDEDTVEAFAWNEALLEQEGEDPLDATFSDEDSLDFLVNDEDAYATEEVYVTEEIYAVEDASDLEERVGDEQSEDAVWEYGEMPQEDTEETIDEDITDETVQAAVWEPDDLAPDAEEELLYEDDYITGDPSEPVPYEEDVSGDPNPYETSNEDKR